MVTHSRELQAPRPSPISLNHFLVLQFDHLTMNVLPFLPRGCTLPGIDVLNGRTGDYTLGVLNLGPKKLF